MNDGVFVSNDPINFVDPMGLFEFGIGTVLGPINMNWNSSQPFNTNFDIVTDLEFGGGIFICFDQPFDECEPNVTPFDVNIGTGKYTGISTNGGKFCVNIGASEGFLPIDISFPGASFNHLTNAWE